LDHDEFSRQLDELGSEITVTILAYEVYIGLWPTQDRVDIINWRRGFFHPVRNSLYYRVFMGLNRVLDHDPRTMSLISLLRVAEKDTATLLPYLGNIGTSIRQMRAALKPHRPLRDMLNELRDGQLAHMDSKVTSLPPPTKREIDSLIKTIKDVFNGLLGAHKRSAWSWDFQQKHTTDVTSEVLGVLTKEREERLAQSNRLLRESQGD
jgi:hypothetical protein